MRKNPFDRGIISGGFLVVLVSAILIFAFSAESLISSKEKKGVITYSAGRVRKKQINAQDWQPAKVNTSILSGDRVRTYRKSRAELELVKLDIIRMAPETIIDVMKLYEETKDKKTETKIALQQGDIWAKVKKKDENTKFDIDAPVAVAAITGTVLRMGVKSDSTTELKVYKGEVKITNAPEKTNLTPTFIGVHEVPGPYEVPGPHEVSAEEWIYIVRNMQKIEIDKNGKVLSAGKFSLRDKDEQTDWVKWNLQRDSMK